MADMSTLESKLLQGGLKLTKARKLLLQVLTEIPAWMTASEIFGKLAAKDSTAHFSTVCRNLDLMTGISLLCRVDKENNGIYHYALHDQTLEHHHHLICKSCGKVTVLDFCPLQVLKPDELQDYSELECRFEIYGYCKYCRLQNCKM